MSRALFEPKPWQRGSQVTWDQHVNGLTIARTGSVWELAPKPLTVWVIPDELLPGEQCVLLRGPNRANPTRHAQYLETFHTPQRERIS